MPVENMDQVQTKSPSPEDAVAKPELPKARRPRRDRPTADRLAADRLAADRLAADRVAGAQAIDRMAEAGRRLADQEEKATRATSEGAATARDAMPPVSRQRLPALPTLPKGAPRVSLAAIGTLPANLPLYAAALCVAIGVGGLLGGQFGPTPEGASVEADSERVERPVPIRRETADKTRDEIKGLRAELAALRANGDQLRQAETQKQANEIRALRATLEAQRSETASLKADFAARSDRDKESAQRSEKTAERIDRLERRLADPTATATLAKPSAAESSVAKAAPAEALKAEKPSIQGVILRDVARGVALVETRRGLMEVMPGDVIPGAGRVETIERHAGRWRVLTANGVIDDTAD